MELGLAGADHAGDPEASVGIVREAGPQLCGVSDHLRVDVGDLDVGHGRRW